MTFAQDLDRAAFWDGWVCLACGAVLEDHEVRECEGCEDGILVPALRLKMFLEKIDGDANGDADGKL